MDISAGPCGTNTSVGELDCGAAFNDGQHIMVVTAESFGSTAALQDEGFYVDFIG